MQHAITLRDLLLVVGLGAGLIAMLYGGAKFMAGASSDAPDEGNTAAGTGCIVFVVGLLVAGGCLAKLIF